jgi:hypothetical protein
MKGPSVEPTVEAGNGSWRFAPRRFPGQPAGRSMGEPAMSTNTSILHPESVSGARAGIAALAMAILLAAAALVALNYGPTTTGVDQTPTTDAQVQKALIDVRAGERASGGAGVPSAEFWAEFRAAERELR